jgi:hypothetical protein
MTSVRSVGAGEVDSAIGAEEVWAVVVEEMAGGVLEADGEVKWIVRRAGPDWLFVLLTVMGTAGLWYLRRRRQVRQKSLAGC